MRIRSLKVKDFFILKDFKIEFNSNLSVLIGENGSGKSTVLELIADIFGHLHKHFVLNDYTAAFVDNYEIIYEYPLYGNQYIIEIHSHGKNGKFVPKIWINNESVSIAHIEKEYGGMNVFLPSKTILAYAGVSDHLKKLSEHFENKYKTEIIKVNNQYTLSPLNLPKERPFIYIKPEHFSMLVLAILMSDDERDFKFVKEYLSLDKNECNIDIVFKKPKWAKKRDKEGWKISGNVAAQFFETMDMYADKVKKEKDILIYHFDGTVSLEVAFDDLSENKKDIAFTIFDTLLYDDLLSEIRISWDLGNGDEMDLNRLSEGQKQILLTLGVNCIFEANKNLLYLYDEPDVFLHPRWQQEYVLKFQNYNKLSHVIITTHNPILLGNVQKEQIHEIRNGKEVASNNYSYGRDVNSILKDYFKANERSKEGDELIKNFYDSMGAQNYDKAEAYLKKLKENFGSEDVSTVRAESFYDDLAE